MMDRYNGERYYDPTAYEALSAIIREEKAASRTYLPLVYIASPFSGDTKQNIECAKRYCRFAVNNGCIPLAPHLHYPQFMDDEDPDQRELGLRFALVLLSKCDELWVMGNTISGGMVMEIAKAERRGIPTRYFNSKCEGVYRYE